MRRARPASDLEHLIMRRMGHAIGDLGLVGPGDRILVAVSGGKDSFALLKILDLHRRRAPFEFEVFPVFLDAGWDPESGEEVREQFARFGFDVEVVSRNIKGAVVDHTRPGSNPCAMCCRMRRGVLYDLAPARGYNKIALGHHLDDLAETLLLNLFHTGQIKSMAVNLISDDGRNQVIRPLAYVEEGLLIRYREEQGFVPVEVACPNITGRQDPRRELVKKMISRIAEEHPRVRRSLLAALRHVRPSHLLDPDLQDRSPGTSATSVRIKGPTRKPR